MYILIMMGKTRDYLGTSSKSAVEVGNSNFKWKRDGKINIKGLILNLLSLENRTLNSDDVTLGAIKNVICEPVGILQPLKGATEDQMHLNKGRLKELEEKLEELDIMKKSMRKYPRISKATKELEKSLKITIDEINCAQTEMEIQKTYLDALGLTGQRKKTSDEIWDTFLSMSEDEAPRINLDIGGKIYEIRKGKEYKGSGGWESGIIESIRGKICEIGNINGGDDVFIHDDYAEFVLKFMIRPFVLQGKCDEKTIKYYVGGIINCVNRTDIVETIYPLYVKKKEINKMLDDFGGYDLREKIKKIREIEKDKEEIPNQDKFSLENFKRLSFSAFLSERLQDEKLKDSDKEAIEEFLKLLESSEKSLDDVLKIWKTYIGGIGQSVDEKTFSLILGRELENQEKEQVENLGKKIEESDIVIFKSDEDFLEYVEGICKKDKKDDISKKIIKKCEDFKDKVGSSSGDWSSFRGHIRSIVNNGQRLRDEKLKNTCECFKSFRKDVQEFLRESVVKNMWSSINSCFKNVLKVKLTEQDLNIKQLKLRNVKELWECMIGALVGKINEARYSVVSSEKEKRLQRKQSEEIILKNIDLELKRILIFLFNNNNFVCDDIIENLNDSLEDLKNQLDECWSLEEYGNIEKKIKELKDSDDMVKLRMYKGIIDGFEEWKKCDISGIEPIEFKRILGLEKLFHCDGFELGDKFEISNTIFKIIKEKKEKKIMTKKLDYNEMLGMLFKGEKLGTEDDGGIDIDDGGNYYKRVESDLLNEIISLKKEYEEIMKLSEGYGNISESDREMIRKQGVEYEESLVNKLILSLKLLKLSEKQSEEIKQMCKDFPGAIGAYIDSCLVDNDKALKFNRHLRAINYSTGKLNFSVIQAGILKKAVENGNIKKVLHYLGFYYSENLSIDEVVGNSNFKNVVIGLIEYFCENGLGCFSKNYFDENGNSWRKLDFQKANNLIHKKKETRVFSIGEKNDNFRIKGLFKDGYYVLFECFFADHDKYQSSLKATEDEKNEFKKLTGIPFE